MHRCKIVSPKIRARFVAVFGARSCRTSTCTVFGMHVGWKVSFKLHSSSCIKVSIDARNKELPGGIILCLRTSVRFLQTQPCHGLAANESHDWNVITRQYPLLVPECYHCSSHLWSILHSEWHGVSTWGHSTHHCYWRLWN